MRRLKTACELAKKELSTATEYDMEVPSLAKDEDFELTITRDLMNEICGAIFDRCIPIVNDLLEDCELTVEQIDDIVLVGGSSRIPRMQELLKETFGKPLCFKINPDEAVAYGATVQAALLTG